MAAHMGCLSSPNEAIMCRDQTNSQKSSFPHSFFWLREAPPIHGDGCNVRSYMYCEDVAEAFEVVLHKGSVGHVYNFGEEREEV